MLEIRDDLNANLNQDLNANLNQDNYYFFNSQRFRIMYWFKQGENYGKFFLTYFLAWDIVFITLPWVNMI